MTQNCFDQQQQKIKRKPVVFSQMQTSAKKMGLWQEELTFLCARTQIQSSNITKCLQISLLFVQLLQYFYFSL